MGYQTEPRGARRRCGQILFLEFVATLPIFALLFYSAMSFHIFYKYTRQNQGAVQLEVSRWMDAHWIEDPGHEQQDQAIFQAIGAKTSDPVHDAHDDDQLAHGGAIAVDQGIRALHYWHFSTQRIGLPLFKESNPTGVSYQTRDSWAHRDIKDQLGQQDQVESMPYNFYQSGAQEDLSREFLRM